MNLEEERRDILSFVKRMSNYVISPFFAWDSSSYIQEINLNLTNLIGEEKRDILGKTIYSLFSEEFSETVRELNSHSERDSQSAEVIIPIIQKSGQMRAILWKRTRIKDSSGKIYITIAQGIEVTEQRWAIEYLERYIGELSRKNDELENLRIQLEESNKNLDEKVRSRTNEIEELLKQKDEFINQIGHDLKTPLTPILALTPILLRKESDPKKSTHLETINRNANQLHVLLTGLIKLAYLNKAYMPRKGIQIPVNQMIEELIVNSESEILHKHLIVNNEVPESMKLLINPVDFDTVFGNLIDNAIKFTDQGGKIVITGKEEGDLIKVIVSDTGIGLNTNERKLVFNPLYKADSSRHNMHSYGLGLAVTKEIIEQNGGTITVLSDGEGKGSSFIVCFRNRYISDTIN